MIALLVPTKGRPQQFKRMIESALATSDTHLEVYVNIEGQWEGEEQHQYEFPKHDRIDYFISTSPPGMPTGFKWNLLAEEAMRNGNKLFMLGADDMVFATPNWDEALISHYNSLENKIHVYSLQDSRDKLGTPHPIMTREWIEAMGYFVPPIFLHWFIDSWTVDIAKSNNIFTHLKDYLLIHDKPSDSGKPDHTHLGIRSMGWQERDAYVARVCQRFLEFEKKRLKTILAEKIAA